MKRSLSFASIAAVFLVLGSYHYGRPPSNPPRTYAPPPRSILICGIQDRPCVTYSVLYHEPAKTFGDSHGEGVTDYQGKTISLAWSNDRFENVRALEHEVFHAALWERGFRDTDTWDIHAWIYFSESSFPLLFHDNPEFVNYITAGY
jgi:hypothetical protein